jgi:hypothetical protein
VLEGRPHCVDAIRSGEVQLVINTTEGAREIADSFPLLHDGGGGTGFRARNCRLKKRRP